MPKEPKVEHPDSQHARSPMKTWRILFLDNPENIERLKNAGKDVGYTVAGALTIDEAWAFLDGKDHVDVIVCAAHLEEESMFEFLKEVRDNEVHRNAMFLILSLEPSGKARGLQRSTASAAKALGADTYAVMPVFDANELIGLIKELLPAIPKLQESGSEEEKRESE